MTDPNVKADAGTPDVEELRKQTRAQALADAAEIAAFCDVAGRPKLTASCIEQFAAGKSKLEVFASVKKVQTEENPADIIDGGITAEAGARVDGKDRYKGGTQPKLSKSLAEMQRERMGVK